MSEEIVSKLSAVLARHCRARSPALNAAVLLSIVIGLGAVLSVSSNVLLRHERERVVHSFQVMRAADEILIGLIDAETGQRGFLISADADFLEPYETSISKTIPRALKELRALVSDSPAQAARVDELLVLANAKLEELGRILRAQQQGGTEVARALFANRQGKDVMDRIRSINQALQLDEQTLLSTRSMDVRRDEQRIILTIVLVTTLSTVMRLAFAARRQKH